MIERPAPPEPDWRAKRAIDNASTRYGVDWWVWRIVISPDMKDGLADIRERWPFSDLFEAQVMLDTIEECKPEPESA